MGVNASAPAPTGPGSQLDGARVRVAVKERYFAFLPKYINRHAALSEEKVRLAAHHWNYIADEVGKQSLFFSASPWHGKRGRGEPFVHALDTRSHLPLAAFVPRADGGRPPQQWLRESGGAKWPIGSD